MSLAILVLAAGRGSRMQSRRSKVMHPLCGKPLLEWVLDLAASLTAVPPAVVMGADGAALRERFGHRARFCVQPEPRGTGDAVIWARDLVPPDTEQVMVLYGDMPLLRRSTLAALAAAHHALAAPATALLTVESGMARGFGRVVRNGEGRFSHIVEERHCSPAELALTELNAGIYVFEPNWLFEQASRLPLHDSGERYLTDLPGRAASGGLAVATASGSASETIGVNDRVDLARAAAHMRHRINERHMRAGVTLIDPNATYIDAQVRIGPDTVIEPGTVLSGDTVIGTGCHIGPHSQLHDSRVDADCHIPHSVLEGAVVGVGCTIGPFGRLRPGAVLGAHVHMGSFGEVKDSVLGAHVHMGHFSYVGNAELGEHVNVAAGTITCNFDGRRKHRTVVEDNVFLGSGTKLVAPVTVKRGAQTGAGAVVTRDVPEETLVYGVPARPAPRPDDSETKPRQTAEDSGELDA